MKSGDLLQILSSCGHEESVWSACLNQTGTLLGALSQQGDAINPALIEILATLALEG